MYSEYTCQPQGQQGQQFVPYYQGPPPFYPQEQLGYFVPPQPYQDYYQGNVVPRREPPYQGSSRGGAPRQQQQQRGAPRRQHKKPSTVRIYTVKISTRDGPKIYKAWEINDYKMDQHFRSAEKRYFSFRDFRGKLLHNVDAKSGWRFKMALRWDHTLVSPEGKKGGWVTIQQWKENYQRRNTYRREQAEDKEQEEEEEEDLVTESDDEEEDQKPERKDWSEESDNEEEGEIAN